MKKFFWLLLLITFGCGKQEHKTNVKQAALDQPNLAYFTDGEIATYQNKNFSFLAQFSSDFKPLENPVPVHSDGTEFSDGKAQLSVWGSLGFMADEEKLFDNLHPSLLEFVGTDLASFKKASDLKKLYLSDLLLGADHERITYKLLKDNYYVISGYDDKGNIFYQKTVKLLNHFANFRMVYPSEKQKKYESTINQIEMAISYF
ncbi:hypothetical protein V6R21_19305 [Limibacter armeniacum]|uniref:hypothetical protein n=1 Tax=Limibacter armeniacum TaxID=466084 RepID=UPI002FE54EF2